MTEARADTAAVLDTTGLLCPLPVLKARRALKPLAPGAVLEVLATDPGAVKDFEHFCKTTGCDLLEIFATAGRGLALSTKEANLTPAAISPGSNPMFRSFRFLRRRMR